MRNFKIKTGPLELIDSRTFMVAPEGVTTITSDYLKIIVKFIDDEEKRKNQQFRIGASEVELHLHNVFSGQISASSEPMHIGELEDPSGQERRVYFSFVATRIDGCNSRLFAYQIYLSEPGLGKQDWELF